MSSRKENVPVPAKKEVEDSPKEPKPTSVSNSLKVPKNENPAEPSDDDAEEFSSEFLELLIRNMWELELYQGVIKKPTASANPPVQQPQSLPAQQPQNPPAQQPQSLPAQQPQSLPAQQPQSLPAHQPQSLPAQQPQSLPAQQPQSLPAHQLQSLPAQQPQSLPAQQPQSLPAQQPQSLPAQTPQSPTLNPLRSSPQSKQPNDGGQPADDVPIKSLSMADRIKRVQQHLRLYLHATECQRRALLRELHNVEQIPCDFDVCKNMKSVLNHMSGCEVTGKNTCAVPHCDTTRQISQHWKICKRDECQICTPFKQGPEKSRYNANSMFHRSPSVFGAADIIYHLYNKEANEPDGTPTNPQQQTQEVVKSWQKSLKPNARVSIIYKLVHTIFFLADPRDIMVGPQLLNSIASARRVENFLYKVSNSISEYYSFLAEILFKMCYQINIPEDFLKQMQEKQPE